MNLEFFLNDLAQIKCVLFLLIADWKWKGRRSVCLWPGCHCISYPGCSDRRKPGSTYQSGRDLPSKERGVSESLKYLLDFWHNMLDIRDKLCFLSCFQGSNTPAVVFVQWFSDWAYWQGKIPNIRQIPTYPIMKRPHVYTHSEFSIPTGNASYVTLNCVAICLH